MRHFRKNKEEAKLPRQFPFNKKTGLNSLKLFLDQKPKNCPNLLI